MSRRLKKMLASQGVSNPARSTPDPTVSMMADAAAPTASTDTVGEVWFVRAARDVAFRRAGYVFTHDVTTRVVVSELSQAQREALQFAIQHKTIAVVARG